MKSKFKRMLELNDGLEVVKGRPVTEITVFDSKNWKDVKIQLPDYGAPRPIDLDPFPRLCERVEDQAELRQEDPHDILNGHPEWVFDDSDYPDCGFWAMAEHTTNMSQLDRMISESCYRGIEKISDPRPNFRTHSKPRTKYKWSVASKRAGSFRIDISNFHELVEDNELDGCTTWQRPEWVMRKTGLDELSAERLIEAWEALNFSWPEVKWALDGIAKTGRAQSALVYFRNMAAQLDEVTVHPDPFIIETEYVEDDYQDEDEWETAEFERMEEEREATEYYVPLWLKYIPIGRESEDLSEEARLTEICFKHRRANPELMYYSNREIQQIAIQDMRNYLDSYKSLWLIAQPRWFVDLIWKARKAKEIETLSSLGTRVHKEFSSSKKFSWEQAGAFWSEYHLKKTELEKKAEKDLEDTLIFIRDSKEPTGQIGIFLRGIQRVTKELKFTNDQWTVIWDAYHARKALAMVPEYEEMTFWS